MSISKRIIDTTDTRQSLLFVPQINVKTVQSTRQSSIKASKSIVQLIQRVSYQQGINHRDLINLLKFQDFNECKKSDISKFIKNYFDTNFNDLPLFMTYQLAKEFQLQQLQKRCKEQLVVQNFEQMNYSKLDLVKTSIDIFENLLEEYRDLVLNLQIPGLQTRDLKIVIDDYCSINNVSTGIKNKFYDNYLNNPLYEANPSKNQTMNSMIEVRQRRKSQATKNSPNLLVAVKQDSDCQSIYSTSSHKSENAQQLVENLKYKLELLTEKNSKLYSDLKETLTHHKKDPQKALFNTKLKNIENNLNKMSEIMKKQSTKLNKIEQIAYDLNSTTTPSSNYQKDKIFQPMSTKPPTMTFAMF